MSTSLFWSSEGGFKTLKQPLVLQEEETKTWSATLADKLAEERQSLLPTVLGRWAVAQSCSHHSHLPPTAELTMAASGHELTVQPPLLCGPCPKMFIFSLFSRPCSDHF